MSDSQRPQGLQPTRLLRPWDSPGKNTGVCCPALLQGIFPTQGPDPSLPHCRQILCLLNYQGGPNSLIVGVHTWQELKVFCGLSWWLSGRESICQCRRRSFLPWVGKIPWRRKWQPTPFCLGSSTERGEPHRIQSMGSQKSQTQLSNQRTSKVFYSYTFSGDFLSIC